MLENIKSGLILKLIFRNINKKLQLKLIKFNRNLTYKLNIGINDYKIYQTLTEFNKKYSLKIEDNNIEKIDIIDISNNDIKEIINYMNKIEFKKLKQLSITAQYYCFNSHFSDITILKDVKLEKLEKLNLWNNIISNIDELENVNFNQLKELNLGNNKIYDISVIKNVSFKNLEILNLSDNFIVNIDILEYADFRNLKKKK